jgi:hypothetical protein
VRHGIKHVTFVAVLAVALAMLVACGNSSRAHASQKTSTQHAQTKRRLSIGMTKKQVVRVLGCPKTIRGNYWYWPVVGGKLASKTFVAVAAGPNHDQVIVVHNADQFRILFVYGVLQTEEFRWHPDNNPRKRWASILI